MKRAAYILSALLLFAGTAYADPILIGGMTTPVEWAAVLCEALLAGWILDYYGFAFTQTTVTWAILTTVTLVGGELAFGSILELGIESMAWGIVGFIVVECAVVIFEALLMGVMGRWRLFRPHKPLPFGWPRRIAISVVLNVASILFGLTALYLSAVVPWKYVLFPLY